MKFAEQTEASMKRARTAGCDYRFLVANFLVRGEEWTELPDKKRIRNRVSLKLGGYDIDIIRTPESFDLTIAKAKGTFAYTTDIVVHNVRPSQRRHVEQLVDEIAELLSFATMSQVVRFGGDYNGKISRQSVSGQTLYFRPALGASHGAQIKDFLVRTWPTYHRLRKRRMLNIVIAYVVTAELSHQPVEVRMLLGFVALENLKSTYAREAGYKFVKSAWRRISTPPKSNPAKEPIAGFEDLLREMMMAVKMKRSLKRIVQLRNQIVHNGVSPRPIQSQIKGYFDTQDLAREYLLRLLGFKGTFYGYNNMDSRTLK